MTSLLDSLHGTPALLTSALLVVVCGYCLVRDRGLFRRRPARFGKKPLMTDNEREFFGRLKEAARQNDLEVYPQVAMGALMVAKAKQSRFAFAQKIVDFVLVDSSGKVLALIELDDRMHDRKRDRARDAMTREAGYRTLRYESRAKPSVSQLSEQFRSLRRSWF